MTLDVASCSVAGLTPDDRSSWICNWELFLGLDCHSGTWFMSSGNNGGRFRMCKGTWCPLNISLGVLVFCLYPLSFSDGWLKGLSDPFLQQGKVRYGVIQFVGALSVGSPLLVRYCLLGDLLGGGLAGCLSWGSSSLSVVTFCCFVGNGIVCVFLLLLVIAPPVGSGFSISLAFCYSSCSWVRAMVTVSSLLSASFSSPSSSSWLASLSDSD